MATATTAINQRRRAAAALVADEESSTQSTRSHSTNSSFDEDEKEVEVKEVSIEKPFKKSNKSKHYLLHPTYTLPLLVMLDMFSVSLVVPLLQQYYKDAGVTSSSQRELLSSLFSSSQIVGGLVLGALADAGVLHRRTILLVSFAGSAVAYGLIVYANNIQLLILSRILVGLVKQTMTISMTLLAKYYTTVDNRALWMGRLHASSTMAWIVGPSVGAMLYKHAHHKAPALLAVALFGINMILAAVLLPREEEEAENAASSSHASSSTVTTTKKKKNKFSSFSSNLRACFVSPALGSAIISMLLFTWFTRATSYASMASYYEEMYGMEPHHRGYLSSYQQMLSLVVQSLLVGPVIFQCGGERTAATLAAFAMALATLVEYRGNLTVFLLLVAPVVSLSMATMSLSLRSLITHVAPNQESLGSVLAALDVLQNATAVTVPFYRTFLFSCLTSSSSHQDPRPTTWVASSFVHWFVAACAMGGLLLWRPNVTHHTQLQSGGSKNKKTL